MAQGIMSIRVDNDVRKDINEFSKKVGISVSTLVNLYFKKVIDEQKIPFEISVKKEPDRLGYSKVIDNLKEKVIKDYPERLSLEEVNIIFDNAKREFLGEQEIFGIQADSKEELIARLDAISAIARIREDSSKRYPDGKSLEEINEIIDKTRRGEE